LLLLVIAGCLRAEPVLKRFSFQQAAMGTVFKIDLFAKDEATAASASAAAFERVEALNRICSDYLPDSELIRLCQAGSMKVSDDLFRILDISRTIAKQTGGAFDPTIGHLTNLWRRSKRKGILPTDAQLIKAKALTKWRYLMLDDKTKEVTLAMPGMQLDLGGIAKGFAADEALAVLKLHGITRAVVSASGDLAIGDPPPGEAGWEIGLRTFEAAESQDKQIKLRLANCGVSTSGDLHQWTEIDGVRYSHIIQPATGLGLTQRIACSVIAPNATTSDALATTMCVLGREKGGAVLPLFEKTSARFVDLDAEGKVRETKTPGFP
jgi:thiamine biosynthesis lipoprotein